MVIPMDGHTSELANFLHQKIRNRGIGTALNLLALEIAREQGRRRVWLSVEPSNRIAIRSYEKAGFRHEGTRRQSRFHDGQYHDAYRMGILREEFEG